jgi:hypothetical protein
LPTLKEFDRTLLRLFTCTQRRAAEPGIDHCLCHSAGSIFDKRDAPGAETDGTGTVVATLFRVLSALHEAVTAMPTAANRPPARPSERRLSIVNAPNLIIAPDRPIGATAQGTFSDAWVR